LKELERRQLIRQFQQQEAEQEFEPEETIHIPINDNRDVAAAREGEKQGDLKKQSQFSPDLIGVKPFMKGDYDKKPPGGDDENKANQSQFQTHAALNTDRSVRCSSDI
jgi:hypothetical protein